MLVPRLLGARVPARSHIYDEVGGLEGATAVYTLADPRDTRCPRYVGQTRDVRRRFMQHVHTARLWLPDDVPWWVRSPKHRPLYEWIRALYRDGGRLPVCGSPNGSAPDPIRSWRSGPPSSDFSPEASGC